MVQISEDTLIYDIETKTFGKPNPQKDIMKLFGSYSYKTNKYYLLKDKETIKTIINNHKYLVGFNNINYDNPILEREGFSLKYKNIIDLANIIDKRKYIIKTKDGLLSDLLIEQTLKYITQVLGLVDNNTGKMELDYSLLKKDILTDTEMKLIYDYTKRDLEVTKKLYEWCEDFFEAFKFFVIEKDIINKSYLTAAPATFAYKALCKEMSWEVEYSNFETEFNDKIGGGYTSFPAGEKFEGNIYLFDFKSLYPHIMMQCDLHGRKKPGELNDRKIWVNTFWKVEGTYYADEMSAVSKVIQKWFAQRAEYKKAKDKREHVLKILMNILFGILENPKYAKTSDHIAAGDCTSIGRQWAKYARKVFRDNGYILCYTATDSFYLVDPFNDKEKLLKVKNKIIEFIKTTVPFPQDTFDMELEAEIKYLFFFKGGDKDKVCDMDEDDYINKGKGLMKLNYIYITKDDKVVVKNLGMNSKKTSLLSREIFWKHMMPIIKETGDCKFSKTWIKNLIQELLQKDINLASIRYSVGDIVEYKNSPGSIYAQISEKYGSGIHFMIPNLKNIGVGKGKKKYCNLEEFKKNNLRIEDIDLDNIYKELEHFTKPVITKNIFDF